MAFKTAKQQLCDLYNAANPTLPFPLTETDFDGFSSVVSPD